MFIITTFNHNNLFDTAKTINYIEALQLRMSREEKMIETEWEFAKHNRDLKDYDIPERPTAPDVEEDHPEHLSAENTWDVKP